MHQIIIHVPMLKAILGTNMPSSLTTKAPLVTVRDLTTDKWVGSLSLVQAMVCNTLAQYCKRKGPRHKNTFLFSHESATHALYVLYFILLFLFFKCFNMVVTGTSKSRMTITYHKQVSVTLHQCRKGANLLLLKSHFSSSKYIQEKKRAFFFTTTWYPHECKNHNILTIYYVQSQTKIHLGKSQILKTYIQQPSTTPSRNICDKVTIFIITSSRPNFEAKNNKI